MEDILKNSLYEAFVEAADNVYIYVTDMKTGVARWSKRAVRYFDMPGEYMDDPGVLWGSKIHPDDRDVYYADIEDVFSGKKNHHSCQYRVMNRYGKYVWLECKGTMIYDEDGSQIVFAGMMTRLDSQSRYDPLTGLLTKNTFYEYDFTEGSGMVLLVGIDNFRRLINTYGYNYGNEILVEFARCLASGCEGDQKALRFNGDEFILILPGIGKDDMVRLFQKVQKRIETIVMPDGKKINLTVSAGAESYPMKNGDKDDLVNRLESAMDYVKRLNKGTMAFYSGEVEAKQHRRGDIKKDLKNSIANNFEGFELYYQPWINARGTEIQGCEALLRWKGEQVKDAGPMEFIPILEEDDSIIEVGRWVMQEAMKQQKRLQKQYGDFMVSFNVSYRQFLGNGYVEDVVEAAKRYGVNPSNMVIELTESCDVENPENLAVVFRKLREYGFKIALDDFGTGYASMELLKKLPADEIKIEHNFVRELKRTGNGVDFAIIESIMLLCKRLKCGVVVEGVENEEVDEIIRNMDATYLQGYYYSKPVCREEFEQMLEDNVRSSWGTACPQPLAVQEINADAYNQNIDKMVVSAMSNMYIAVYMFNLQTDTYQEYHAIPMIHKISGYSGRITGNFSTVLAAVFAEDFTEYVLEFANLDTLAERLKNKNMILRDFLNKKHGWYRLCYIPVKYDEQGNLENVLFIVQKIEEKEEP